MPDDRQAWPAGQAESHKQEHEQSYQRRKKKAALKKENRRGRE
jgi:hypothetical protein